MKKTLLSLLLLVCMALTLVSCGYVPYDYNLGDYISLNNTDYRGFSVTQEQVDAYIHQNYYTVLNALVTAEKPTISLKDFNDKAVAQIGDTVTFTYAGFIKDEVAADPNANPNGNCTKTEATDVVLGTGTVEKVPQGFTDAIIGAQAGGTKEVDLTYPDDYEVAELQGKEVTFKISVSKIARPLDKLEANEDATKPIVMLGDKIKLDYSGMLKGETTAFEGGTATDASLWIGSDNFIKGFESQLINAPIGVELKLPMTFPEDYSDATKAGKDVVFTVTVKSIQRPNSQMTIEQVNTQNKTTYNNFDEWYADLTRDFKQSTAVSDLTEAVKILSYPEEETTRYAENIATYYEYYASMYGTTLANYVSMMGYKTLESFVKDVVIPQAQAQVKEELTLLMVAQKENITISDAELETYIAENYADGGYESAKEFKKEVGEDVIRIQALCEKVTEQLGKWVTLAE